MLRFLIHKLKLQSLHEHPDVEKESEYVETRAESDDESQEANNPLLAIENKEMKNECELRASSEIYQIHLISRREMVETELEVGDDCNFMANRPLEYRNYISSAFSSDSDNACDDHSSEEELDDIHDSYQEESLSCVDQDQSLDDGGGGGGASRELSVSENKRKWPEVVINELSVESESSWDEEVEELLRPVSNPVEFCTSPPVDAHKPSRSQSPPPKLFLFSSPGEGVGSGRGAVAIRSGGVFKGVRPCDLNSVDSKLDSSSPPILQHFIHNYSDCIEISRSHSTDKTAKSNSLATVIDSVGETFRDGGSGVKTGNIGQESSSRQKRHRHHNPRHIQRPWLDFEKMQQLKARSVISWRSVGEMPLSCS